MVSQGLRGIMKRQLKLVSRRDWMILATVFALFFVCFRWAPHLWMLDRAIGTDLHFYYLTWDEYSASLVFGRLEQNGIGGIFSDSMSLGLDGGYTRQYGLAGWLVTLPSSVIGQYGAFGGALILTIVSAFNALLATAAVRAIRRTLSLGAAILVTIGILQPWSVSIARNVYWFIGIKLLAAAVLILLFAWRRDTTRRVLGISFVFTLVACLSGYEMFTLVAAAQFAVIAFYSLQRRWSLATTIRSGLTVAGGVLGGFVAAIGIHLLQLYLRAGNLTRINELLQSVSSRTGATDAALGGQDSDAMGVSPITVLDTYLSMPVFGVRTSLPILRNFTVGAFILLVLIVIVITFAARKQTVRAINEQAMGVAWIVSLMGALGWFLLARPHSHMHTFIVFALWFLPTIPLGLGLLWGPLRRGFDGLAARPIAMFWIALVAVALVLSFIYSLISVRS